MENKIPKWVEKRNFYSSLLNIINKYDIEYKIVKYYIKSLGFDIYETHSIEIDNILYGILNYYDNHKQFINYIDRYYYIKNLKSEYNIFKHIIYNTEALNFENIEKNELNKVLKELKIINKPVIYLSSSEFIEIFSTDFEKFFVMNSDIMQIIENDNRHYFNIIGIFIDYDKYLSFINKFSKLEDFKWFFEVYLKIRKYTIIKSDFEYKIDKIYENTQIYDKYKKYGISLYEIDDDIYIKKNEFFAKPNSQKNISKIFIKRNIDDNYFYYEYILKEDEYLITLEEYKEDFLYKKNNEIKNIIINLLREKKLKNLKMKISENKKQEDKKVSELLNDDMMTLEEFGNLLNLEEEFDKVSTTPSDEEIKQERSKMRNLNTISWLEAKYIEKNQKYFKKIGKIYTDNKKIKLHFKHLYEKNHNDFKKTNYAHYISWLKNNSK